MRTRLSPDERKADILNHARTLFAARGYSGTEMEDIRLACGVSRGGLYHHFSNKRAILEGLVIQEVSGVAKVLEGRALNPITALIDVGSSHLGSKPGVVADLDRPEDRQDYLSALEQALIAQVLPPLAKQLAGVLRAGTDPDHVAELFLTINAHINRREVLGQWTADEAAGFAATSLEMLAPFFRDPSQLTPIIARLREASGA